MAKIIAKGKRYNMPLEVVCEKTDDGLSVSFNGTDDKLFMQSFMDELEQRYPVAGTFYPEVESLTNALEVLQYHFFDGEPEITVDGDIGEEIPYEDDVIY